MIIRDSPVVGPNCCDPWAGCGCRDVRPLAAFVVVGPTTTLLCRGWINHDKPIGMTRASGLLGPAGVRPWTAPVRRGGGFGLAVASFVAAEAAEPGRQVRRRRRAGRRVGRLTLDVRVLPRRVLARRILPRPILPRRVLPRRVLSRRILTPGPLARGPLTG